MSKNRFIVISDLHYPYEDTKAIKAMLQFIKLHKVQTVILNGDILDMYDVSSFDKSPERINSLQKELNKAKALFKELRRILPETEIVFVKGNHCLDKRGSIITSVLSLCPTLWTIGSILINKYNNNTKKKKIIYIITLLTIISELFLFKYINIFPLTANAFGRLFSINIGFKYLSIIAPLGISFYTLSLTSYVTDVLKHYGVSLTPNWQFFRTDKESIFTKLQSDLYFGRKADKKKGQEYAQKEKELHQELVKRGLIKE